MLPGTPQEARNVARAPRRTLAPAVLERVFPRRIVTEMQHLPDGFRNSNFKLVLEGCAEPVVLRVYEHDASLCRKEADLIRFLAGSVPVPEILEYEPDASDGLPPFVVMRYVEGITFRELWRRGDLDSIAQAAACVGETLAAIHRATFGKGGWLGPGLEVGAPLLEGEHAIQRFVDLCLESANLQRRVPKEVRDAIHSLMWSALPEMSALESQAHLVHGDFNRRNVLVRERGSRWGVAAVLDWEFAVAGTPLQDFGNFLRYERASRPSAEPHFSNGYLRAGGVLPPEWRRLADLVDLLALCASLAEDWLPEDVERELVGLVVARVRQRRA
jgi:aminoglycoside phosphotransferase (APT) family kinase protein